MAKPKPHPIVIICSVCQQPWENHPEDPSQSDCIELLQAALDVVRQELEREKLRNSLRWPVQPVVPYVPGVVPYRPLQYPYYSGQWVSSTGGTVQGDTTPRGIAVSSTSLSPGDN